VDFRPMPTPAQQAARDVMRVSIVHHLLCDILFDERSGKLRSLARQLRVTLPESTGLSKLLEARCKIRYTIYEYPETDRSY
jgi:hypothetical protein